MPFDPLTTRRLVIRAMTADDVDALWERRNHPDVARYQDWEHPYPRESAERIARGVAGMDGPEDDEWWMAIIEDAEGNQVGDLAVHLEWQGRSAELGYNLDPEHWGKGYAVEACTALVDFLFDEMGVGRVFGMLHPDNRASAQVLERIGMLFEGHTRSSFWDHLGEVSDDWIYGMTVEDRDTWRARPRGRPESVRLALIDWDVFDDVYPLQTHKSQASFVAPMPKSLAQAFVSVTAPENYTAWPRAVYADDVAVGFVMVAMPLESNDDKEPFLWRLLIDRMHQRRGIASMALALVEEEMRSLGHTAWKTSWIPGRGSPEPFYLGLGFEPTGEMEGDEIVGRKVL